MPVRLQKFLADAGVASRRASEAIIQEGRVSVNGVTVTELGTKIDPAHDRVALDGHPLRAKKKLYVAVNKPLGYLCTRRDPENRRTIGELLPKEWTNLYTVGRLDRESEGLIFLTNDGDFSLKLTHPRYGVRKKYHVVVPGKVDPAVVAPLVRGVQHDGERLKAEAVKVLESTHSYTMVEVELREGKNREVRRMFSVLGLEVLRLKRVQIGRIKLGDLPDGRWRTLTEPEIKSLLANL